MYRTFLALLRAAVDSVLRYARSRRGNDGLTANERRLYALRYRTTVGHLPPPSDERYMRLNELADKAHGRTWTRSAPTSKSA